MHRMEPGVEKIENTETVTVLPLPMPAEAPKQQDETRILYFPEPLPEETKTEPSLQDMLDIARNMPDFSYDVI